MKEPVEASSKVISKHMCRMRSKVFGTDWCWLIRNSIQVLFRCTAPLGDLILWWKV